MPPVAILAGGLATRLGPLTDRVPKSLLQVAGRPFLLHQLELLKRQGIERVVLCVGHMGRQIEALVGDGSEHDLEIHYSYDGERLRGTGGALLRALPLLGETFFVTYGDSYLPCDIDQVEQAFRARGRLALMTLLRNDNRWDRSNVRYVDGELVEYDKRRPHDEMRHIDAGFLMFAAQAFASRAAEAVFDLGELCQDLLRRGELAGLEIEQRFYEIGSIGGMLEADAFLSRRLQEAQQ